MELDFKMTNGKPGLKTSSQAKENDLFMREREKTKDFSKLCLLIMNLSVIFTTVFLSKLIIYQLILIHWVSYTTFNSPSCISGHPGP